MEIDKRRGTLREDEAIEWETSGEVRVQTSFEKMGLKEPLLKGIFNYGLLLFFFFFFQLQNWSKKHFLLGTDGVMQDLRNPLRSNNEL